MEKLKKFIEGANHEDYLTFSVGYEYEEFTGHESVFYEIERFFAKILHELRFENILTLTSLPLPFEYFILFRIEPLVSGKFNHSEKPFKIMQRERPGRRTANNRLKQMGQLNLSITSTRSNFDSSSAK